MHDDLRLCIVKNNNILNAQYYKVRQYIKLNHKHLINFKTAELYAVI